MKFLVMGLTALALAGCSLLSGGYRSVKPGMSQQQVNKIMGACSGVAVTNGRYTGRSYDGLMPFVTSMEPAMYSMIFKDDVLVAMGEGSVTKATVDGQPGLVLTPPPKKAAVTVAAASPASSTCAAAGQS